MRRVLFLLLFLCVGTCLYAQAPIRFGDREVYLEANVHAKVRGHKTSSLELGIPTGEKLNVLVQFGTEKIAYDVLKQKGVELGDYLGSNAYYAQVVPGSRPSDFVGTGLRTVVPIRGEWKVVHCLLQGQSPEWASEGDNLKVNLVWFKGVTEEQVRADLSKRGVKFATSSDLLRTAQVTTTREQLLALADVEYVAFIRWIDPPTELENYRGARLNGAANLRILPALGGRGLTGKGVRIGIWDGNVEEHVDYGNRVHRCEFEIGQASAGGHGMHTTGTILGAGLLDEKARGMAPEAEIWTWNFNVQSNGKTVQQEMLETYEKENISITSNSYGFRMSSLCRAQQYLSYTFLGNPNTDRLAYYIPTLTHCYSAGNDQGACSQSFAHATNYAKNIISVGALTPYGAMTDFSSFGPLRDGRMFPIICARGKDVYSVMPNQGYDQMSGTSMSCPTVAGHLALLTQRWGQLHGGAIPYNYYLKALIANTADEAGNLGPDYKYGFGNLNAIAAVTAMENNWHHFASLAKGGAAQTKTIDVPAGVKELRVMLCWNDPVANKEYALGECPLVNDLDLTLVGNGTTYYPYTLDPNNPNTLAVATKKNEVDNIEQVVVKNPVAGTYTINVAGAVNQEAKQDYVLVWYFDYQRPAITSPMMGDVYAPGAPIFLRTENLVAPLKVELSTDLGATFTNLAASAATTCISLNLPKPLAPTDKATIRVTDAKGVTVQMQGVFSIMSFVTGVKLEDKSCATEEWKLKWDAADNATKYEILQADINKGAYTPIATVDAPALEYPIPADKLLNGRNIFAVRALSADGIAGRRSVGILSMASRPAIITEAELPYLESFVGSPFQHTRLTTGKNLKFTLREALPALKLPFDSHMLQWEGVRKAAKWDDPFAQTDNVATVATCELDLSAIPEGTKLQLLAFYFMTKSDDPNGALLRLKVGGTPVPDVFNRMQIPGDGESHNISWDLTAYAGQKISIALETALESRNDAIVLVNYRLIKTGTRPDVGIAQVNNPEIVAKPKMADEEVNFRVINYSSLTLKDVPVTVQVDGKVVYTHRIETMKPFEDVMLAFTHDFATDKPHKFDVVVRVDVENDARSSNNERTFQVYNMGSGITMPEVEYIETFWGVFPQVPYISTKMSGKTEFTDGRGALEPYKKKEQAVLQVLPTKANAAVQVVFKQYAFNVMDTLYVFAGNVPDNLGVTVSKASYRLTGTSIGAKTFISEAENGGLTFAFVGASGEQNDGWLAELAEVEIPNQWKLKELREANGKDENHKKIEAVVENLLAIPFHNVGIYFTIDGAEKRFEIPTLAPKGETVFALPKEVDIAAPMRMEVEAMMAKDGDVTDNTKKLSILHDPIWDGGGTIKDFNQLVINIVSPQDMDDVIFRGFKKVLYRPDIKIPIYTQTKSKIKFTVSPKPRATHLPAAIRLFIDLNGDNILDDTNGSHEMIKNDLVLNTTTYTFEIDLSTVPNLQAGERRMRIILANDENYAKFKNKEEIEWGHVIDFMADIKTGNSPVELGLVSFVDLQSGRTNLTATTPIKVKLRNNGRTAVTKVKLTCKIDDLDEFEEEFDCNLAAEGGEAEVEFGQKGDFTREGKHTVKVALKEKDANEKDNELKINFFKIPAQTEQFYSLAFVGDNKEAIALPNIGKNLGADITIEGWWKLNETHSCAFFDGGESGINLGVLVGNSRYPDNTLVFFAGSNGVYVSKKAVVQPGKWQHIAMSIHNPTYVEPPCLYVDGEKVELERQGTGSFSFTNLWLNIAMKGQNAMCRVWNTKRTPEQLKENMIKSVRGIDGNLPADCKGEFIYTEGKGRLSSTAQKGEYAYIISERPENEIWRPLDRIFRNVEVVGQATEPQFITENEIKVFMPQGFSTFDKVKVKFFLNWVGTEVKHGGTLVTDDTEIDFSTNAEHKLSFTLENANFFGKNRTETVSIQLVNDLSNACELLALSLPKVKNPGLKNDLSANNPQELIEFIPENESATSTFNYKDAVVVVSGISPDAELYMGAQKVEVNSEFHVDFSTPLTLKVLAQNKRDAKFYTVRMALPQTIAWSAEKLERVYTGTGLLLDAQASSGLPITYQSSDPTIATIDAEGNLITVAVGTATITAKQEGDETFKPAENKTREVEVKRADLSIEVEDITMAQGDALPEFTFKYNGLAFPNTEWQFDAPYEIRMPDNKVWNASMPPLPMGDYTIAPKDYTQPYEFGNYKVTRTTGTLHVTTPKDAKEVTIAVKDEKGAALKDVMLKIGEIEAKTGTDGSCNLYLLPGKYAVSATKSGYTADTKTFEVKDQALTVELELREEVYTLTYTADAHGMIQGRSPQKVASGRDGEEVVALARDIKYRFVKWDDDNTNPVRVDKAVTGDKTVKALFEAFTYTLTYEVGVGGEFDPITTVTTQQVVPGTDGAAVTVKAKEGYIFIGWSDGVKTATRTDMNVRADLSVKALFFKPLQIAWIENFELGSASIDGWEFDKPAQGLGWYVMPLSTITTLPTPVGNAVGIVPSFEKEKPRYKDVWVATPWLSLEGRDPAAKVTIWYNRYVSSGGYRARLEYCFEDGEWQNARPVNYGGSAPENYVLDVTKLASHRYLRFRWVFTNTNVFRSYLAIDNISVKYDPEPANEVVLQYFAGENGMLQKTGETSKVKSLRFTTTTGNDGPEVAAVPNEGCKFVKWSDNVLTEKRKDNTAVRVEAIFEAIPKPKYTIQYTAGANGKIVGQPIQMLAVDEETASVTAEANTGYSFKQWNDGRTDNPRTDVVGTENKIYTAEFAQVFTLTYEAGEHGTIKGEATQNVFAGGSGTEVEAVPDNGYRFVKWDDDKKEAKRTETNVQATKTYKAEFIRTFTLKYIAGDHGTIEGDATQTVDAGGSGTAVTAIANEGYRFVKWDDGKKEARRTDANVTENKTYKAEFEAIPTYAVTLTKEGEGELKVTGIEEAKLNAVPEGTELTAVATPAKGWKLKSLTAGTQDISSDGKFTVTANVEVKAVFEKEGAPQPKTYAVTLKHDGEGELKITGIEESKLNAVPEGTELTAVATPATGWKLKSLTAGTQDISADGKFTVTADIEIKAVFVKEGAPQPTTFAVTLKHDGEGELKVTGIEEAKLNAVPEGTELTAVATPAKGWKLKSLTAGTQDISSDGKFTVTADVEVKAVFEKEGAPQPKTYVVTLMKEGEGELKVTGIEEAKLNVVPEGTELTAVATPATGWKLKSLTAGDKDIVSDGKFTVTDNVEVKAVFEKTTAVDDAVFANVLVAPNPFIAQLRLVCNGAMGRYDLLNAQGVVVRSGNMDGNEVLIETSDLTSGLYLLRLTTENGAEKTITVVKE